MAERWEVTEGDITTTPRETCAVKFRVRHSTRQIILIMVGGDSSPPTHTPDTP